MFFVIVGLKFGDEGKGLVADWLCRNHPVHTIVRYNGGPQAAHNVITSHGVHHTFRQFGSGSLAGRVNTFLPQYMLVEPFRLLAEGFELERKCCPMRIAVDSRALIVTPFHQALNRRKEEARARIGAQHGSTGLGIGETRAMQLKYGNDGALTAGDLADPRRCAAQLQLVAEHSLAEMRTMEPKADIQPSYIAGLVDAYRDFVNLVPIVGDGYLEEEVLAPAIPGDVVFEGAQGVLLDEDFGFHPHTTWSKTTSVNALRLIGSTESFRNSLGWPDIRVIGVMRTYETRHGAGPLPTEDPALAEGLPEPHNSAWNQYTGDFRRGRLDLMLTRYALERDGQIDMLAVTHMDAVRDVRLPDLKVCQAYESNGRRFERLPAPLPTDLAEQERLGRLASSAKLIYREMPADFVRGIEQDVHIPIGLTSYGPTADDVVVETAWNSMPDSRRAA